MDNNVGHGATSVVLTSTVVCGFVSSILRASRDRSGVECEGERINTRQVCHEDTLLPT